VKKISVPSLATRRAQAQFQTLVRPHLDHLYKMAYRFTGTTDRAEDLIQDLLVRVYPRCEELAELEQPRPWLARVMYRIFIDQLRHEIRSPHQPIAESDLAASASEDAGDPYAEVADSAPGPEEAAEMNFDRVRLAAAWDQLSPDHRALLTLFEVEGYSLPELEEILDLPRGTIKSRLHRARERLAALVSGTEPFDGAGRVKG